jgi:hypothetical protein
MVALLCFLLALSTSPFKSKSRLEAVRHQLAAAAEGPRSPRVHKWRSVGLRPTVSTVSVSLERNCDHPARDPRALASCRLPVSAARNPSGRPKGHGGRNDTRWPSNVTLNSGPVKLNCRVNPTNQNCCHVGGKKLVRWISKSRNETRNKRVSFRSCATQNWSANLHVICALQTEICQTCDRVPSWAKPIVPRYIALID